MKQVLYKNDIYPYNVRVLLGADEEYIVKTFANLEVEEHAACLMGWLVDKVCGAYHKFKKEEEKDGKEE